MIGNVMHKFSGGEQMTTLYQETLPEGKIHLIQEVSDQQIFDNTPEFVVPAGTTNSGVLSNIC